MSENSQLPASKFSRIARVVSDSTDSQALQSQKYSDENMVTPSFHVFWMQKVEFFMRNTLWYVIQQFFTLCLSISKVLLTPIIYPFYWAFSLFMYCGKIIKLGFTFLMNGLHGVFATLSQVSFGQRLHYAVLKENGLYMKVKDNTLDDIFTYQLYDYTIRKFMTLSSIEQDLKVAEIQPWSHLGMRYLRNNLGLSSLSFFHNSQQKIEKIQSKIENLSPIITDYSSEAPKNLHDIFIMFNRDKDTESYSSYVDLIKIMSYTRRNLTENGYMVFGNPFASVGQIAVFQELIESFGFKIQMKENITSNLMHSRKILKKTYKNRKLTWLRDRFKQFVKDSLAGDHLLGHIYQGIWLSIQKITGIKYGPSQYLVYILELNI